MAKKPVLQESQVSQEVSFDIRDLPVDVIKKFIQMPSGGAIKIYDIEGILSKDLLFFIKPEGKENIVFLKSDFTTEEIFISISQGGEVGVKPKTKEGIISFKYKTVIF